MNKLLLLSLLFIVIIGVTYSQSTSIKKGTTFGSDPKGDTEKCADIDDLNVSWYYNWDKKPTCLAGVNGVEFIPTIWGAKSLPIDKSQLTTSDWLFGFNEPNYGNQANLTPKQAADLWPQLEATGKKLIGPSMADCGTSLGGQCTYSTLGWYKEFLGNCTGCRVDAVALHLYYCDADDMMNKINALYDATKLPVWLTEFACNSPKDQDQVVTFAQKLLPMLESSNAVARYSWFLPYCDGCKTTDLLLSSLYLDQNGVGNLSPIGKYYAGFKNVSTTSTTTTSSTTSSTTTATTSSTTSTTSGDNSSDNINGAVTITFSYIVLIITISTIFLFI